VTPTEKLAGMIVNALLDLLPQGTQVEQPSMQVAQGYWRHVQQDVMPWQAGVNVRFPDSHRVTHYTVGSWDTVTACARRGFELADERSSRTKEVDFAAHARPKVK
jgi:hypothetical protein